MDAESEVCPSWLYAYRYRLVTAVLLSSLLIVGCQPLPHDQQPHLQRMPENDFGVYVGCMRAVARLTVRSRAYWTIDEIALFCDDIRRSFDDDRQRSTNNET